MKSVRYIITRPCLQEGSLRLLKYIEGYFPEVGPAQFVDDRGQEHGVQIDRERGRVWGLGGLYHAQHLGVNDVLMITALAPGRYQVEGIVKPHAAPPPPRAQVKQPEARRVVVSSTPHVREVRLERLDQTAGETATPERVRPESAEAADKRSAQTQEAAPAATQRLTVQLVAAQVRDSQDAPLALEQRQESVPREATPSIVREVGRTTGRPPVTATESAARAAVQRDSDSRAAVAGRGADTERTREPQQARVKPEVPRPSPVEPVTAHAQMVELARLTGYRLDHPGGGLLRLSAELGPQHSYTVLIAPTVDGLKQGPWQAAAGSADTYRLLLTPEGATERPAGVSRLTEEALAALIEHARLAPIGATDLRGYWRAGNLDLESAASIAELVSAHLAQRGAFSFVLLTLAQQPAHSVVSVTRLAERLGSGVNTAELTSILDTLTRAPFLALTPLPGGQYLLRVGVGELLGDLSDYAQGVRRRMRTPAPIDIVTA